LPSPALSTCIVFASTLSTSVRDSVKHHLLLPKLPSKVTNLIPTTSADHP
jgi:hypothetical protein